ncbi:MAG: methyl-accepting chemotaxis protein [Hydrogenovibrio sp.]
MFLNSLKHRLALFSAAAILITVFILMMIFNGILQQKQTQVLSALSTKATAVASGLYSHAISKMEENIIFTTRDPVLMQAILDKNLDVIHKRIFPTGNRLEATGVTTNLRLLSLDNKLLYTRNDQESGDYNLQLATDSVSQMKILSGVESVDGAEPEIHLVFPLTRHGQPIAVVDMALSLSAVMSKFKAISNSDWAIYSVNNHLVSKSSDTLVNYIKQASIPVNQYGIHRMSEAGLDFNVVTQPIYDYQNQLVGYLVTSSDDTQTYQASDAQFWWGALAILAWLLVVLLATGYTLARAMRPLELMHEAVAKVRQNGDFTVRVPTRGKDEIASAAHDINELIDLMQQALKESNRVMHAVAEGDFTQRMQGDHKGALAELQETVNQSTRSVDTTMRELTKVVKALHQGDFSTRMSQEVKGEIRYEVDAALSSLHATIEDTNRVLTHMAEGDFSQRVQADAFGDLKLLRDNVNGRVEQTAQALDEIAKVVKAMASGDLTQRVQGQYKGQFGTLSGELNNSLQNIAQLIHQTSSGVHSLLQNVDQIHQGTQDLNDRTQRQAQSLDQTTLTISQITKAVDTTTGNAHSANQQSQNSRKQSEEGAQIMRSTIESMGKIRDASHKIEEIISLIDSIAFQTNLLALNAAVEAARAGEHGRGFAVVAGEVRNLAGKSADAARDIKGLIENAVHAVEEGTERAESSDQALQHITESIRSVSDIVSEISSASETQSQSMNQINQAIGEIDDVTQQNAALVEQTTAASEAMREAVSELEQLIAKFKV